MKKNRMTYLDMAKGIGILFMIVGHTISLGWQKDLIYSFHMPLFFVCSGMTMVLSNNWLEWREAAKKSAKRLLLPALVLFMVMTVWTYLVEGQFDAAYTKDFALNRLASLLLASGSDVMVFGKEVAAIGLLWFLPALFFARLLLDALPSADAEEMGKFGSSCMGTGSYIASATASGAGSGTCRDGLCGHRYLAKRKIATVGAGRKKEVCDRG